MIVTFRQAKAGVTVAELCHKGGIRDAPVRKCRASSGGMDASLICRAFVSARLGFVAARRAMVGATGLLIRGSG